MLAFADREVTHENETRLRADDLPPMDDRGFEPGVSIVTARKKIEALTLNPFFHFNSRELLPAKRSRGICLRPVIDPQGIVHRGAAKAIAIRTVAGVLQSPRVGE